VLVYGDHQEVADVADCLASIGSQLGVIGTSPPGIERHASLVSALIETGRLVQGLADRGDEADEPSSLLQRLAIAVVRSFDSGYAETGDLPPLPHSAPAGRVRLRLPEGFAFYGVYPESYIAAARRLKLSGPPRVIGIRSIGTTLAAVVAAALDGPPALTVRPFGDPFARQVELPPSAIQTDEHYIIVDEGPGLSGSSFGAVADRLQDQGVALEQIAFLPSHGGDLGPEASLAHRDRWHGAQRQPAEFDPAFLVERFGKLEPFSGGGPRQRIKYLAGPLGERLLLKFAGLGRIGERKLEMARTLHAHGFTPEPLGLVHGFLVERWVDARALGEDERPVQEIGRYLGARACLFSADEASGASIDELIAMCRRNITLGLGEPSAGSLPGWDSGLLSRSVVRVRTDNKLDRIEWLRLPDDRLLKTDAVDHHQAHDLIGCQDIAWDIAGAITEFELDEAEAASLILAVLRPVDDHLLKFYRFAYPAFRLGAAALGGGSSERYVRALKLLLHPSCAAATPRKCSVD